MVICPVESYRNSTYGIMIAQIGTNNAMEILTITNLLPTNLLKLKEKKIAIAEDAK